MLLGGVWNLLAWDEPSKTQRSRAVAWLDRVIQTIGGSVSGRHVAPAEVLAPAPGPAALPAAEASLAHDEDPIWSSTRISVAEALWGEGFLFPGGAAEVLRLTKPLGLTPAESLLLIGAGTGGPPRRIAAEFGVWVTGYEANPCLMALANERSQRAGLGRRALVERWDPDAPKFPRRYFHHGMAIEALGGLKPERLLGAAAQALKPGAQLVLLDMVADLPLDPADPLVATWAQLEHRSATVPSELAITDALARLKFDVRIVEDVSRRHVRDAIKGWRAAVQGMAAGRQSGRQSLSQIAVMVHEAEPWLARFRLMRMGRLRLVRWHAIGRG